MKSLSQIDFAIAVGIFLGVFAFSILFTTDRISGIKDQIESLDQYLTGEKILSSLFLDSGNLSLVSKAYRFYVIINNTQPYLKNQSAAVSDLENELVIVNFSSLGCPDIDFNSVRVYNSSEDNVKCEVDPERKILKFLVNISAFESKEFKVWFDDDSNFTVPFCNFSISGSDNLTEIIYPPEAFKIISFSTIEDFSVYDPEHLVDFYTFDEPFGEKFIDRSGNGNTGTFHGEVFNDGVVHGATWVDGKYGKALSFDGVDDYVDISSTNSVYDSTSITVEAWVKPYSGNTGWIVGDGHKFRLRVVPGSTAEWWCKEENNGNSNTISGGTIEANKWYHVVGTYDSPTGEQKLYINGVLVASATPKFILDDGDNNQAIGKGYVGSSDWFKGIIDEVRIYNRSLSESEIKEIYENNTFIRDGLVAYWRFDEGDGSVAHDSHHIVYSSNKGGSKYGNAISFDGVNDYVEVNIGNSILTDFTDAFSVEAWVKPSAITTEHGIIYFDENLYLFRMTYYTNNRAYAYVRRTDDTWMSCSCLPDSGIQVGNWYHYVVVFDGRTRLYVNGKLCCKSSSTGTMKTPTGSKIWIGRSGFLNGTIDDIRIYNRSLNETEIKLLYQHLAKYNQLKKQISSKYDFHVSIITNNETILDFGPPVPQRSEVYALDRPVFVQLSNGRLEEGTLYVYLWK